MARSVTQIRRGSGTGGRTISFTTRGGGVSLSSLFSPDEIAEFHAHRAAQRQQRRGITGVGANSGTATSGVAFRSAAPAAVEGQASFSEADLDFAPGVNVGDTLRGEGRSSRYPEGRPSKDGSVCP